MEKLIDSQPVKLYIDPVKWFLHQDVKKHPLEINERVIRN